MELRRILGFIFLLLVIFWLFSPSSIARLTLKRAVGVTPRADEISNWQNNGSSIRVFDLIDNNYSGKLMLIKLTDTSKLRVVPAGGGLGSVEKTSSMARRAGAIAAINGGGFLNKQQNSIYANYPLRTVISEGKVVSSTSLGSANVIGFTKNGKLVVERPLNPELLLRQGVQEAVSFRPLLVKNGQPVPVKNTVPDPHTAIGQKKDGTLIFLVIDGRRKGWSTGVTLAELQQIMLDNGAWIASNLDGGGSSTMYFDGEVLNRPSDFFGERQVATSIVILP